MTKFKQGDRVVPERFEKFQCGNYMVYPIKAMEKCYGVEGGISYVNKCGCCIVHGISWPSSALRQASPKWEPVVGENAIFRDRQVIIHAINDIHVWISYDGTGPFTELLSSLRPIAPSPEEEVGSILCKLIGGDNYILRDAKADIMAIFNRHKEGEGR